MLKKDLINEVLNIDTLTPINTDGDGDDKKEIDYDPTSTKTTDDHFDQVNDPTDRRYMFAFPYYANLRVQTESDSIIDRTKKSVDKTILKNKIVNDIAGLNITDKLKYIIKKLKNCKNDDDKVYLYSNFIPEIDSKHRDKVTDLLNKVITFKNNEMLNEENKRLSNSKYKIPEKIVNIVKKNLEDLKEDDSGYEFLKNLSNDKTISYENLKRKIHNYEHDDNFKNALSEDLYTYFKKLLGNIRNNSNVIKGIKDDLNYNFGFDNTKNIVNDTKV